MRSWDKTELRNYLKKERNSFLKRHFPVFEPIYPLFLELLEEISLSHSDPSLIAGYWPLKEEADCRPLLTFLAKKQYPLALPSIESSEKTLLFRAWKPQDPLVSCPFFKNTDLLQPQPKQEALTPCVLLVPFLGFDKFGNRLGYGQGYYDATLKKLREAKKHPPIAIGFGFSIQEVDQIPHTHEDARLDWILTEKELRKVAF